MDPTAPIDILPYQPPADVPGNASAPPSSGRNSEKDVDLRGLYRKQLELTEKMQDALLNDGMMAMSPREVKETITSITSVLTLGHRTEEILKELDTYKLFKDVVMEWARRRSDDLAVDLVAEIRKVADELRDKDGNSARYAV